MRSEPIQYLRVFAVVLIIESQLITVHGYANNFWYELFVSSYFKPPFKLIASTRATGTESGDSHMVTDINSFRHAIIKHLKGQDYNTFLAIHILLPPADLMLVICSFIFPMSPANVRKIVRISINYYVPFNYHLLLNKFPTKYRLYQRLSDRLAICHSNDVS